MTKPILSHFLPGMALMISLVTACGAPSNVDSILSADTAPPQAPKLDEINLIDSSLLEIHYFEVSDRSNPSLAELGDVYPVIVVAQPKKAENGEVTYTTYGFPVLCKNGRDWAEIVNAFGYDNFKSNNQNREEASEADLIEAYHVDAQPILRCDALPGQQRGEPQFRRVLKTKVNSKVRYFARFNSTDPKVNSKIYEVGCRNLLQNFVDVNGNEFPASVIHDVSLSDVPGTSQPGILPCVKSKATELVQDLGGNIWSYPLRIGESDVRLYAAPNNNNGVMRVAMVGDKAFAIDCSTSSDGDLQKAFNFPVTDALNSLATTDPDYAFMAKINEQPTLFCPSPTHQNFATDAYFVENQFPHDMEQAKRSPMLRLAKVLGKSNSQDVLVEFGCDKLASFFEPKLISRIKDNAQLLQPVFYESLDDIVRINVPNKLATKRYFIGCHSDVTRDQIKQTFRDVYAQDLGGDIWNPDLVWSLQSDCRNAECSVDKLASQWIDRIKGDRNEVRKIVMAAFMGTPGFSSAFSTPRPPYPEEMNYFLDQATNGGVHRPHYSELKNFLASARTLDRTGVVQSLRNTFGVDSYTNFLGWWTQRQFNDQSKTFTTNDFTDLNETYSDGMNDVVFNIAYADRGLPAPTRDQIDRVKELRKNSKTPGSYFNDVESLIDKSKQECVTVDAKKTEEKFQFVRLHIKVKHPEGKWTNVSEWYGPEGIVKAGKRVGQLQFGANGNWTDWWEGIYYPDPGTPFVVMRMYDTIYTDNSGSLKVCFE